jgi:hypothetical protein
LENCAPVAVFVFKKLEPLKLMIESLKLNPLSEQCDLFIFSDGWRNLEEKIQVKEVRKFIASINGFKSLKIIESDKNLGLAESIIRGVSEVISIYGNVIVLEDDLILSSNFLSFINKGLDFYKNEKKVLSICGYSPNIEGYKPDVFFTKRSSSWGWATWVDRWDKVDWECSEYDNLKFNPYKIYKFNQMGSDLYSLLKRHMSGQINSWAIRFCLYQFNEKLYSVHPTISKVQNIGFGNIDATHTSKKINRFKTKIDNGIKNNFDFIASPKLDKIVLKQYLKPFTIYERLKSLLNFG